MALSRLVTLFAAKEHQRALNRMQGELQSRSGRFGKQKNPLATHGNGNIKKRAEGKKEGNKERRNERNKEG